MNKLWYIANSFYIHMNLQAFFNVVNYQENFELIFILEKVLKTQFEHKTKGSMVKECFKYWLLVEKKQ